MIRYVVVRKGWAALRRSDSSSSTWSPPFAPNRRGRLFPLTGEIGWLSGDSASESTPSEDDDVSLWLREGPEPQRDVLRNKREKMGDSNAERRPEFRRCSASLKEARSGPLNKAVAAATRSPSSWAYSVHSPVCQWLRTWFTMTINKLLKMQCQSLSLRADNLSACRTYGSTDIPQNEGEEGEERKCCTRIAQLGKSKKSHTRGHI